MILRELQDLQFLKKSNPNSVIKLKHKFSLYDYEFVSFDAQNKKVTIKNVFGLTSYLDYSLNFFLDTFILAEAFVECEKSKGRITKILNWIAEWLAVLLILLLASAFIVQFIL